MLEWTKLSCAVDLSEPSRIALEYAADLASRLSAELILVHAHVPHSADALLPAARGSTRLSAAERTLERWRAEAETVVGTPVRSRILFGEAVPEIVRHTLESGCELLIVGTHGRTGLPRLVLGSVAEQLIRQSPCPVFVARERSLLADRKEAEEFAQYR